MQKVTVRRMAEAAIEAQAAQLALAAAMMGRAIKGSTSNETPAKPDNFVVINPMTRDGVGTPKATPQSQYRWRALPADHPLVKAKVDGRITLEEFNAGNCYRVIYAKAQPHTDGRDSTQAMLIDKRGGPGAIPSSYVDKESVRALRLINQRLSRVDNILIEMFCGLGRKASEAMRRACPQRDPRTVWDRMSEALGELERAIAELGIQRPDGAPELAA